MTEGRILTRDRMIRGSSGQASVEFLAALPAFALTALICLQLLAAGYALTLADGAAEAGAAATAAGLAAEPAVRASLPGWARSRVAVSRRGGSVTVRLRPPSPLPALGRRLAVSSAAWVRSPGAGR